MDEQTKKELKNKLNNLFEKYYGSKKKKTKIINIKSGRRSK